MNCINKQLHLGIDEGEVHKHTCSACERWWWP